MKELPIKYLLLICTLLISVLTETSSKATTATINDENLVVGVVYSSAGTTTTLMGSGTGTGDLSYQWTKTSGGPATIVKPTAASTQITGLQLGVYQFTFTVTDSGGTAATDSVWVSVVQQRTWNVNGITRKALLHVPQGVTSAKVPLMLFFHGDGGSSLGGCERCGFERDWPECLVVYMEGIGRIPWQMSPGQNDDRDIHYVDTVLSQLESEFPVDKSKVFATGHSRGGFFLFDTLWPTRGSLFRALGPVSAQLGEVKGNPSKVNIQGRPHVTMFHLAGRSDGAVPIESQQLTAQIIRNYNQCDVLGQNWTDLPRTTDGIVSGQLYPSPVLHAPYVFVEYVGAHNPSLSMFSLVVKYFKELVHINTAPSIQITAPDNGATLAAPATLAISANSFDNDGTISNIEFFKNGTSVGVCNASPYKVILSNLGAGSYKLKATVTDNSGATSSSDVTITVKGSNSAPVAQSQSVTTAEELPTTIMLAGSDAEGDPLTYHVQSMPSHGALNGSGTTRTYTPAPNYHGKDSFTFSVNDGKVDSNIATISIGVKSVNDAPAVNITGPTDGATFSVGDKVVFTASASDVDGKIVSVEFFNDGKSVGVSDASPYKVTLSNLDAGSYKLKATATDNTGATASSEVTITVKGSNSAPVAQSQSVTTSEDVPAAITLAASDADGDALTYHVLSMPSHGVLKGSGTTRTYTPSPNYHGTDSFTFSVTDGKVDSNIATISIGVTSVNDAPAVNVTGPADGAIFSVGDKVVFTASASDVDGTIVSVEYFSGDRSLGVVTEAPYTYATHAHYVGAHIITAKATDNNGSVTISAPITITVNALPTCSISTPLDGTVFKVGTSVILTANASDVDGAIASVEYFSGDRSLGIVTEAPYIWKGSAYYVGEHIITAKATDNHGATRVSAPITITIVKQD